MLVPVDADAGGFEDALDGRHLVEAEAAALNQGDANGHESLLLHQLGSTVFIARTPNGTARCEGGWSRVPSTQMGELVEQAANASDVSSD